MRPRTKNTARLTGVLASTNGWSPGSSYDGLVIDVPVRPQLFRLR